MLRISKRVKSLLPTTSKLSFFSNKRLRLCTCAVGYKSGLLVSMQSPLIVICQSSVAMYSFTLPLRCLPTVAVSTMVLVSEKLTKGSLGKSVCTPALSATLKVIKYWLPLLRASLILERLGSTYFFLLLAHHEGNAGPT